MKKNLIALCLASLALASCGGNNISSKESTASSAATNSSESIPPSSEMPSSMETAPSSESSSSFSSEPIEIEKTYELASSLYMGATGAGSTFPTLFFNIAEDVPYLSLSFFAEMFLSATGVRTLVASGNALVNTGTNESIVFDVTSNSISANDLDQATNFTGASVPNDPFCTKNDVIARVDETKTSYTKGKQITISLDTYKARLVEYKDDVWVPFSFLNAIYLGSANTPIAFNGNGYFLMATSAMLEKDDDGNTVLSPYGEKFYEGSLSKMKTRSASYSSYFYWSFVFEMTYFNGKMASLGISDLDAKLDELGLKEKMLSSDSSVADEALATAIYQIFSDGGHTGFSFRGLTCPFDLEENDRLGKLITSYDSRYTEANKEYSTLHKLAINRVETLETSGKTAIIHLDSFDGTSIFTKRESSAYPTEEDLLKDYQSASPSTFALLYFSFKEIKKNSDINNVVFDVSMNPGGEATALGYALSFISDEPVKINFKSTMTGATYSEACHIDNDLDPNTDNDSYEGQYNFFILTSSASFSCGNAFPCIAKDNNLATIIGRRSGGGDCAVRMMTSEDGSLFQTSSTASIRHEDGSDVDGGQKVDYEYPLNDFYDKGKLDSFLNALAI
jgi:hypothetical protein